MTALLAKILDSDARTKRAIALLLTAAIAVLLVLLPIALFVGPWYSAGTAAVAGLTARKWPQRDHSRATSSASALNVPAGSAIDASTEPACSATAYMASTPTEAACRRPTAT
jgi:hypothetical protein